ncbi:MAG: hypothetical protein M1839_004506 [Geoglossum umbratile]|nr:MAG: hypothetical protein M1839_004506 [Geoglossum umbratile]
MQAVRSMPLSTSFVQETYPTYSLHWDNLKTWLEDKFPGLKLKEGRVKNDEFLFELPRRLTDASLLNGLLV